MELYNSFYPPKKLYNPAYLILLNYFPFKTTEFPPTICLLNKMPSLLFFMSEKIRLSPQKLIYNNVIKNSKKRVNFPRKVNLTNPQIP